MTFLLPYQKIHLFIPYSGKIATIKKADNEKYFLDLATVLNETRKIVAVFLISTRISGSGGVYGYPNEGSRILEIYQGNIVLNCFVIADGTQRLQHAQDTGNEEFDIYCQGYVVEV